MAHAIILRSRAHGAAAVADGACKMIFTTYWYLIFFASFLALYYAIALPAWRSALLLGATIVFYLHFAGPVALVAILSLAALTYATALGGRPRLMTFAIVVCAADLVFYKYTAFIVDNAGHLLGAGGMARFDYWPPAAPLAVSFFAFEFVHYLYDVRHGNRPVARAGEFLHFSMFFPTLVAGPIKRYEQFVPALRRGLSRARPGRAEVQLGLLRVTGGFAKKIAADSLSAYVAAFDTTFEAQGLGARWLVFAALAMRIYLDFSGYSDMAIGCARMMGIAIPENFRWPYLATSVRDFWRRWHISLSSWIRDYLYVPLGGNKRGRLRQARNLVIVFFVCGLWHGAAWHFVYWGLYHGCGLALEQTARGPLQRAAAWVGARAHPAWRSALGGPLLALRWLATTLFVWSGWLLFFYPPARAWDMFLALFHV